MPSSVALEQQIESPAIQAPQPMQHRKDAPQLQPAAALLVTVPRHRRRGCRGAQSSRTFLQKEKERLARRPSRGQKQQPNRVAAPHCSKHCPQLQHSALGGASDLKGAPGFGGATATAVGGAHALGGATASALGGVAESGGADQPIGLGCSGESGALPRTSPDTHPPSNLLRENKTFDMRSTHALASHHKPDTVDLVKVLPLERAMQVPASGLFLSAVGILFTSSVSSALGALGTFSDSVQNTVPNEPSSIATGPVPVPTPQALVASEAEPLSTVGGEGRRVMRYSSEGAVKELNGSGTKHSIPGKDAGYSCKEQTSSACITWDQKIIRQDAGAVSSRPKKHAAGLQKHAESSPKK